MIDMSFTELALLSWAVLASAAASVLFAKNRKLDYLLRGAMKFTARLFADEKLYHSLQRSFAILDNLAALRREAEQAAEQ